jgi:hypothetical protein
VQTAKATKKPRAQRLKKNKQAAASTDKHPSHGSSGGRKNHRTAASVEEKKPHGTEIFSISLLLTLSLSFIIRELCRYL